MAAPFSRDLQTGFPLAIGPLVVFQLPFDRSAGNAENACNRLDRMAVGAKRENRAVQFIG
jgi:hypothetical protein